jgi:hypothetical protein
MNPHHQPSAIQTSLPSVLSHVKDRLELGPVEGQDDSRRLHGHRGTGRVLDRVGDQSRSGAAECPAPSCLGR